MRCDFSNPYLKYWLVYGYLLFAAAWAMRSDSKRKYILAACLASISLAVTVRAGSLRYAGDNLDIQVLDVGQGQCVLLSSGGAFTLWTAAAPTAGTMPAPSPRTPCTAWAAAIWTAWC